MPASAVKRMPNSMSDQMTLNIEYVRLEMYWKLVWGHDSSGKSEDLSSDA